MLLHHPHPAYDVIDWQNWTPIDRATLCFVVREGRVLLIDKKRGLGKGKVNGPGGRLEAGEGPEACAVRETQEELGVTPTGLQERGRLRFQFEDGYALDVHVFHANGCEGDAVETEEAVPLWTPLDAIPYERMWADDALWLPHFLRGDVVDGSFLFAGDVMVGYTLHIR